MNRDSELQPDSSFDNWAAEHMKDSPPAPGQGTAPISQSQGPNMSEPTAAAGPQVYLVQNPPPQLSPKKSGLVGFFLFLNLALTLIVLWRLIDPRAEAFLLSLAGSDGASANSIKKDMANLQAELSSTKKEMASTRDELSKMAVAFQGTMAKQPFRFQFAGALTNTDPRDRLRKKSYCKVFRFDLLDGRTYQIDLTGVNGFDTYLRIDLDNEEVKYDDDSGPGQDARIVFRCNKSGEYHIVATTFIDDATGLFILQIHEN